MARLLVGWVPLCLAGLMADGLAAQEREHPPHHLFELGEFELESGSRIPDARVVFATHGELDSTRSNAVLLPSFFLGNHHGYDAFIGPSLALDPEELFIIVAEMFGSGGSSSPSN